MSQYTEAALNFAYDALKGNPILQSQGVSVHRDLFPDDSCWPRVLILDTSSTDTVGGCGDPVSGQIVLAIALEIEICPSNAEVRQKRILDAIQSALVGAHDFNFFGEDFTITMRRNGRGGPGFTRIIDDQQIRRVTPLYRAFVQ